MLGARLVDNTIKFVQIRVKVKHVHSNPLHDVDVLGQHHDRLEIALHEGSIGERAAEV